MNGRYQRRRFPAASPHTHAALSPLIGLEFDELLGAPIDEDRNETTLSVLSMLAGLDVD